MASDLLDRDGAGQGGQAVAGAQDQIDAAWEQRMVPLPDRYEIARQAGDGQRRRFAQPGPLSRKVLPASNDVTCK